MNYSEKQSGSSIGALKKILLLQNHPEGLVKVPLHTVITAKYETISLGCGEQSQLTIC